MTRLRKNIGKNGKSVEQRGGERNVERYVEKDGGGWYRKK